MERLYYSISEVAQMVNVNASSLRFWETQFKELNPKKNSKGTRFYTAKDIDLIKLIYHLTREQNLPLDIARTRLKNNKSQVEKNQEISERLHKVRRELLDIRKELIKDPLNSSFT